MESVLLLVDKKHIQAFWYRRVKNNIPAFNYLLTTKSFTKSKLHGKNLSKSKYIREGRQVRIKRSLRSESDKSGTLLSNQMPTTYICTFDTVINHFNIIIEMTQSFVMPAITPSVILI